MKSGVTETLMGHAANPATPAFGGYTITTGWCASCNNPVAITSLVCGNCGKSREQSSLKEWPLSQLEDRLKAQFETEVRRRARLAYTSLQQEDPQEADQMRAMYQRDYVAGKYSWDDMGLNSKNHIRSARAEAWGAIYLIYLALRRCDPNMTQELALQIWLANHKEALAAYSWLLGLLGNSQTPVASPSAGDKNGSASKATTANEKTFDE